MDLSSFVFDIESSKMKEYMFTSRPIYIVIGLLVDRERNAPLARVSENSQIITFGIKTRVELNLSKKD